MAKWRLSLQVLVALLASSAVVGFYLPGVAPRKFEPGEQLHLRMLTLTSSEDQLRRDYYSLKFCAPEEPVEYPENLGELLVGERTEASVYEVFTLDTQLCKTACSKMWNREDVAEFVDLVNDDYRVNMRLDNLPAAEVFTFQGADGTEQTYYQLGYSLGSKSEVEGTNETRYYLHNHVTIKILYHHINTTNSLHQHIEASGVLIVGFEIFPRSVQHEAHAEDDWKPQHCAGLPPAELRMDVEEQEFFFTYDVVWEASDVKWASRWDTFLKMQQPDIHWFSIVNSFVVLMLLTGMVAMIMMRILRKDLYRYNRVDQDSEEAREELREETGWKLVSGDVFRPPSHAMWLAVFIGSGVQVLGMVFEAMIFAALGLLSPSNRGSLMSVMLTLFIIMGLPAGYTSAIFCRVFKVTGRLKITVMTSLLVPGVIFALFFLLNLVTWGEQSVGAVPFGTILALALMWFLISSPLVFVGSFFGFRRPIEEPPTRVNSIPREIPAQPWYMKTWPSVLMGGVLPFGVVFVELFFVLSAIWQHRFYYLFGFMLLVLVILVITAAEITIVMTYFQLCSEDYHWWWRGFTVSGCSAIYFFLYSMFYYARHLHHSSHPIASTMLYFGYTTIASYAFFFLTGCAGFIPTYFFVRVIYGSIKVD